MQERGVRVRQGDFGDAGSLPNAFEGASRVLVVSASALGEFAVRLNRTAIEAARAPGADRVLYTRHMGSNPESAFPPMHTHAATEATLEELGVPFTALRNGFYASSAAFQLGRALETGGVQVELVAAGASRPSNRWRREAPGLAALTGVRIRVALEPGLA